MFTVDEKYSKMFKGQINQVFFYLINKCDANCVQCLYKPMLKYSLIHNQIDKEVMVDLLRAYRELGAFKVTFLGGEPTLHKDLPFFIKISKELGYKYVRIDTNALFDHSFLENENIKCKRFIFDRYKY